MGTTLDLMEIKSDPLVVSAKDASQTADRFVHQNLTQYEFVSVVVPVYNEAKHIQVVLDDLVNQDYPSDRYEVLVVDGLSSDGTHDLVRAYTEKYPRVRLLSNPKRLASAARNIGINEAKGNIILIVDGHCVINNPQMITNVNKAMHIPNVDSLGRPQSLILDKPNAVQRAIALARSSTLGHHPDSFIYSDEPQFVPGQSVAVAYRKSVFDRIGLFDETFDACEDCEFNYRHDAAGMNCYFTPDIGINYVPRESLGKLAKQMVRYGQGRIRMAKKHPQSFSLKMFIPALFLLGLVVGGLLSFVSTLAALTYTAVLALYGLIVLSESIRLSWVNRFPLGIFMISATFVTIHLAAGWGLLSELVFSRGNKKRSGFDQ